MSDNGGVPLEFGGVVTPSQRIRSLADIPDIASLPIPQIEYLVPALGIARNTITLWTGPDGEGKTYLAQVMALAVSRGDTFLGMSCQPAPVLYVDLENPGYVVQDRMQSMIDGGISPTDLRFWGTWLELDQQPPHAGSELLLTIAKEAKPLIIVDPFRYFHNGEENDSTAMAGVMQYLRACAAYGSAVVILHHPSKAEGSTGRGSSAIRGACDLALLHTLDKESSLITLKVDKNRFGPSRTITIRADFEEARFEVSEAPYVTRRNDELDRLEQVIKQNPGISQNAICKQLNARKNRIVGLLKEGIGTRWGTEQGKHGAILYRPLDKSLFPKAGTGDTGTKKPTNDNLYRCSPPLGGNRIQVGVGEKHLPSCPQCGSFAVYPDTAGNYTCMTCDYAYSVSGPTFTPSLDQSGPK